MMLLIFAAVMMALLLTIEDIGWPGGKKVKVLNWEGVR